MNTRGGSTGAMVKLALCTLLAAASLLPAATTYYVATSGDDDNGGTSWADPWQSISNAVAQSADTDTILISNGWYQITAEIALNKAVALLGVGGPATTIVARAGAGNLRIINMTSAGATVAGLTVRGGKLSGANGAGVLMTGGVVSNCVIEACTSASSDFGFGVSASGGLIVSSRVVNCSGGRGAVFLAAGSAIRDSVICSNTAATDGAIFLRGTATRCRVFGNANSASATLSGGGARIDTAAATMVNCVVHDNYTPGSTGGGGIYLSAGRVINCTIAHNAAASGLGGGVRQTGGAISNCIVYYNTGLGGAADDFKTTGGSEGFCCAPELTGVGNNISVPPQFADAAGRDYHLRSTSPCVDAGTNLAGIVDDVERSVRPIDGNSDRQADVDMGAFEMATPVGHGTVLIVR